MIWGGGLEEGILRLGKGGGGRSGVGKAVLLRSD